MISGETASNMSAEFVRQGPAFPPITPSASRESDLTVLPAAAHADTSGADAAPGYPHLPHPGRAARGPALYAGGGGDFFPKKPVRARVFFSPTLLWYERIFHAGAGDAIKQFWKGTVR